MKLCCNLLKEWCACMFFCGSGEHGNSSSTMRTVFFWFVGGDFCLGFAGVGVGCYYNFC